MLPGLAPLVSASTPDPYWLSVSLLLNCEEGAIADKSLSAKSLIAQNGAAAGTTRKFGNYGLTLDGVNDYVSWTAGTELNFGTGDFTWEMWINPSDIGRSSQTLFQFGTYPRLQFSNNTLTYNPPTAQLITSPSLGWSAGSWHHVALARQADVSRLFADGVLVGSASDNHSYNFNGSACAISCRINSPDYYFYGFMDDIRITKGVARYTGAFTVPDEAFPEG